MLTRKKGLLADNQYFSCFAAWESKVHSYTTTYSCSSGRDFFCHLVTCLSNSRSKKLQMSGFGGGRGEGTWRESPNSEVLIHNSLLVNLFLNLACISVTLLPFISPPMCRPAVPPCFWIGYHYPCSKDFNIEKIILC